MFDDVGEAVGGKINCNGVQESVEVPIRTTSFGCGKLGYEIWPSSVFLSMYCRAELFPPAAATGEARTTIVELGAGCGLPSGMLARQESLRVISTDFWMEPGKEFDEERLVPDAYHGVNLRFNVEGGGKPLSDNGKRENPRVEWLDFYDPASSSVLSASAPRGPDWVIASDIICKCFGAVFRWSFAFSPHPYLFV